MKKSEKAAIVVATDDNKQGPTAAKEEEEKEKEASAPAEEYSESVRLGYLRRLMPVCLDVHRDNVNPMVK